MRLKNFKVQNYKVFEDEFSVELIKQTRKEGNFTILTGKNNMGKSTFLEAINEFFKPNTKPLCIPSDCFNNKSNSIVLKSEMLFNKENDAVLWTLLTNEGLIAENVEGNQMINISKRYSVDKAATFSASFNGSSIQTSLMKTIVKIINDEEPYYIRPNMTTEEINKLINTIYSDAVSASSDKGDGSLDVINRQIKDAIQGLKSDTDQLLSKVEENVSQILNDLFKNQDFKIKIEGIEPSGLSLKDLLKNTDTKITIDSSSKKNMLLSEQGTGVQRMSLIYTIQDIIKQKIGNLGNRMLLIDEPEAFLHPEATRQLSNSLYDIGNKMPIIITTHSPVLINLENDHTVIDIFKIDRNNSDAITLFTSENNQFTADDLQNMKILNYVDSYVNEFFFSNKNIIVEGFTEKLVLKYIQKKFNTPFHIVNANGKSTVGTIMKILNQFGTPYYVLHDTDCNPEHQSVTLKSAKTICNTILSNKTENSKLWVQNFTFEKVFYNSVIPPDKKTSHIYKILDSTEEDNVLYNIKQDILQTYNKIFELGIEELESDVINSNVLNISNPDEYDNIFSQYIFD